MQLLYSEHSLLRPPMVLVGSGLNSELMCLPRNLGIVGSNFTRVTIMIPHVTLVLVGSGLDSDLNKL